MFDEMPAGSGSPQACTPKTDPDFIGLRINAPERVVFDPKAEDAWGTDRPLLICGVYRIHSRRKFELDASELATIAHVTNLETGIRYTADFAYNRFVHTDPSPGEPLAAELPPSGQIETGYFNRNLGEFLELPNTTARYAVFVTYGGYRSNTVVVEMHATAGAITTRSDPAAIRAVRHR